MSGWFRTFTRDFAGTPNQGNHNDYRSEELAGTGTMKASSSIETAAAALPTNGTASSPSPLWNRRAWKSAIRRRFRHRRRQSSLGSVFEGWKAGNNGKSWVSEKEKLGGAIALRSP